MITIKKILWAGGACPYQIEAITDDDKYFYLRYRNGNLRFGVWDNVEKCDHTNYIYSKKVGDQYEGWGDQETFNSELKDLVQFPEGFRHDQTEPVTPDYPPEGCWQPPEADEATQRMLRELLNGDSSSDPRNPILPS